MNRLCIMGITASIMLAVCSAASAQEATHAWGSSWDFKTPNEEVAALNRAQLIHQAENGGLTMVTNIAGDVIHNSTYEGPVNQSSSTNVGNMSTTTTNVNAEGSTVILTLTTGQSTSNVNQGASSRSTTTTTRSPGN